MAFLLLLILCIASRVATTIYYIEDPDSLRFALAIVDYSVADLRPHFPGYPVFCFIVKLLHLIVGSYAVAFSIAGGLSLFAIIYFALKLSGFTLRSIPGAALAMLIFFNPLIWLMSNRYMPDLMGAACMLGALYFLLHHKGDTRRLAIGLILTGLLAGIRLSYLPFLLPPIAWVLLMERRKWLNIAALAAGGIVWLVPLIAITGLDALIGAASMQTAGHFTDFGGTVYNEPDLIGRFAQIIQYVAADGMGSWWPGRNWVTAIVAAGLMIGLIAGLADREWSRAWDRTRLLLVAGILSYLLWIWLFQNVLYQNRHILPLLPLLAIPISRGIARLIDSWRVPGIALATLFTAACIVVGTTLAIQHRRPTAIAQAKGYIDSFSGEDLTIASVPLINYYLETQGIEARYLSVQDLHDRNAIARHGGNGTLITIGSFPDLVGQSPAAERTFHHNPYVNGIWPTLVVHVYGKAEQSPR